MCSRKCAKPCPNTLLSASFCCARRETERARGSEGWRLRKKRGCAQGEQGGEWLEPAGLRSRRRCQRAPPG
eukprot:3876710-Rhodomonas_salina.2